MSSLFPPAFDHQAPRDVCEAKHKGSETSREAFERAKLTMTEERQAAYEWLKRFGRGTAKQYAFYASKPLNTVSPRFSELKRAGMIRGTGERADDGCAVLVVVEGAK